MPTVSYGITNTADDAVSVPAYALSSDTGVAVGESGGDGSLRIWAAWRFLGVMGGAPSGATPIAATLVLTHNPAGAVLGGAGAGINLGRVYATAQANAPGFSPANIPSLPAGMAFTALTFGGTTTTIDVLAQVSEWMGRPGWAAGNAITLLADPSTSGLEEWREFYDRASSPTLCAQLSITYTAGGPDETAPTVTSADALSVIEGDALSHALTANEDVTWAKVGGADAAAFTLTGSTLSLSAQTYPSGTFVVVVRATDAADNWTEQTITVTVTQAPLIRFIGSTTGTTSATPPPHQPGDLIVAFAFRDGSATLPTLPTGQDWASALAPTGANTCSMRLAAKIADTSSEATGTFTSATSLIVHVYRPRPGTTLSVGAVASVPGASTTVRFPALTLQDASGNSFVAGFVGHRSVNTTLESPPTGMINRSTVVDATDEAAGHDTNGGATSWPLTTKAVGGTSSGWFGATVEIKVNLPVTARPTFQAFIIG